MYELKHLCKMSRGIFDAFVIGKPSSAILHQNFTLDLSLYSFPDLESLKLIFRRTASLKLTCPST